VFMRQILTDYFRSAFPGVAIQTTEEIRAQAEIIAAAEAIPGRGVVTWSCTEGCRRVLPAPKTIDNTADPGEALKQREINTVYIFRDLQMWPTDRAPELARALKEILAWAPDHGSCVVLLGHQAKLHASYEKAIVVIDFDLPGPDDLRRIAEGIIKSSGQKNVEITQDIIRAMGGLSTTEAENALALSLVKEKKFNPAIVYGEKTKAVKRGGLLELIEANPKGLASIGGQDNLKTWLNIRKNSFTPAAEAFGLAPSKGILIVGVPGTGKSLAAKCVGTAFGIPTVRLDISSLFNSLVGESESRCRDTLRLAEAMSPCVLWIDEIDKGLAGSSGSGSGDSGVTRRVFGTIISWMQEHKGQVFIVATANQVEGLPPEILRKGRFDEIFAVDLPNDEEREAIFKIHLANRKRDPSKFNMKPLVHETQGFTGSEIEEVINAGMHEAFNARMQDPTADIDTILLTNMAQATVPLSKTAAEQIEAIRKWAATRARPASLPSKKTNQPAGRVLA
jgi:SpoVK/Ycf46/Vps4 family AAA+-type ATPase